MPENNFQYSLFEEDYLLRELGQVAHVPQIALTELVANAWDAGASKVDLQLPSEIGDKLIVTDDGHGMTEAQFVKRWMTLRYNRSKHQGTDVEFPPGRKGQKRKAYGRNGVGRHGLLCFGDEYIVESWRNGRAGIFVVGTESGPSPFVLRNSRVENRDGSGTRLAVTVQRHLPDPEEILTVLAARFLHDPEFQIRVNGKIRPFSEIGGKASETEVKLSGGRSAKIIVIDSTRVNHSALHQGIAFWVQRRLVGTPSWSVGNVASFDGRTRFARRYKVIVDTQGFEAEHVKEDWTGFKKTEPVQEMFKKVAEEIDNVSRALAYEIIEESSETLFLRIAMSLLFWGEERNGRLQSSQRLLHKLTRPYPRTSWQLLLTQSSTWKSQKVEQLCSKNCHHFHLMTLRVWTVFSVSGR